MLASIICVLVIISVIAMFSPYTFIENLILRILAYIIRRQVVAGVFDRTKRKNISKKIETMANNDIGIFGLNMVYIDEYRNRMTSWCNNEIDKIDEFDRRSYLGVKFFNKSSKTWVEKLPAIRILVKDDNGNTIST